MAGTVNKVMLIGHLGAEPEIRRTQDGRPVATFSIATNESWRDKATGERKEIVDWHRVVIFHEPLVQVAEQYLKKGSKVYLQGQMKTRKWTDQSGVDRYTTEVVLGPFRSELTLLDRAERTPGADSVEDYGTASGSSSSSSRSTGAGARRNDPDDEIPF